MQKAKKTLKPTEGKLATAERPQMKESVSNAGRRVGYGAMGYILSQPSNAARGSQLGFRARETKAGGREKMRTEKGGEGEKVRVKGSEEDVVQILKEEKRIKEGKRREDTCESVLSKKRGPRSPKRKAAGAEGAGFRREDETAPDSLWKVQRPEKVGNVKFSEVE